MDTDTNIEKPVIGIEITIPITRQRVADLLCCAFEGGSNYWYQIKKFTSPSVLVFRNDQNRIYRHLDYALNDGGSVVIVTNERDEINGKKEWTLDLAALQNGLRILFEKYPKHFGDFLAENEDADTGDAFLQCCCFGNIVFG